MNEQLGFIAAGVTDEPHCVYHFIEVCVVYSFHNATFVWNKYLLFSEIVRIVMYRVYLTGEKLVILY